MRVLPDRDIAVPFAICAQCLAWAFLVCGSARGSTAAESPTSLEQGKTVERRIAGAESHDFLLRLEAGSYARLLIDQHSINMAVECFGPDGQSIFAADNHVIGDTEIANLIAPVSGIYRFRVTAPDKTAPEGRYAITLSEVEPATDRDRNLAAAYRAYSKATAPKEGNWREGAAKSLQSFEESLTYWRAAGDRFEEARTLAVMGLFYTQLRDREKALEYTGRALPVARESGNRRIEAWALTNIGIAHAHFEDKRKAAESLREALTMMREVGDLAGQGTILNQLGRALSETGERRKALECLKEAAGIYRELQDRVRLAEVINNIGVSYSWLGEYEQAIENYQECVKLMRESANPGAEATALNNIGTNFSSIGEFQKALESYTAALEIHRRADDRRSVAINLHNIAHVYAVLGDSRRALKFYAEALDLLRAANDRYSIGNTLNNIGATYADLGEYKSALEIHLQALTYRKSVGDADGEAITHSNLGRAYNNLGEREKGREHLEQAVAMLRASGRRDRLVGALKGLAALHRSGGDFDPAERYLTEAVALSRAIRDRKGEAESLAEWARLERDRGCLEAAQERAEEALAAFESIRQGVMSPSLRSSLVAAVREIQELQIESLVRLHQPAAALVASERGRARSLLDLLGEGRTEIRRGVDEQLLARERDLQRVISAKAALQTRRLAGTHDIDEAAAAAKELDGLTVELEQLQGRIRAASPGYAALTQPAPLDLEGIRSKVLDDETVLLEYTLGARKSYLWAVTRESIEVHELPARAEVDAIAMRAYDLLTARNHGPARETSAERMPRVRQADEQYPAAGRAAADLLLGPVAGRIAGKRLLIVAEGALHYLPFAALPEPGTGAPLVAEHEIVTAPSASVFGVLREETAGRKPAPKTLAILADPVFTAEDPRLPGLTKVALRSRSENDAPDFARLRFSRTEADQIARLAEPGGAFEAVDFDASRETAMRPELGDYRIVHFATHSLLDDEHPELSGVVLSLVDRGGRPQNGFLRLMDIYNLRLGADLVVLSACRTALGRDVKGEGLIGLTRGFLYAGAPRVVATLWEIDDRTTAEAMKRLYEGMLGRGERPAQALRSAQVALWRSKGWESPYYWAAFTLEGEWR